MSNLTSLADSLREATTVLDEEYHRVAVSDTLTKAANELERLHRQVATLRAEKEILQAEVQSWEETL